MEKLKNGAIAIDFRRTHDDELVVLAYWEGNVNPWVTWKVSREGDCYWGHYFRTLPEAALNLEKRARGG